jgi:hypothetical protein
VPLPLDSRTAPAMSAAYVLAVCLRPFALLGVWLSLLRMHVVMRTGKRSPGIEVAAAFNSNDMPSAIPAEKRRHSDRQ